MLRSTQTKFEQLLEAKLAEAGFEVTKDEKFASKDARTGFYNITPVDGLSPLFVIQYEFTPDHAQFWPKPKMRDTHRTAGPVLRDTFYVLTEWDRWLETILDNVRNATSYASPEEVMA